MCVEGRRGRCMERFTATMHDNGEEDDENVTRTRPVHGQDDGEHVQALFAWCRRGCEHNLVDGDMFIHAIAWWMESITWWMETWRV